MKTLKDHYREYLGVSHNAAWIDEESGLLVMRYDNVPDYGLFTFVSLGASRHLLEQRFSGAIGQEFVVIVDGRFSKAPFEKLLFAVARMAVESHKAFPACSVLKTDLSLVSPVLGGTSALLFCPVLYFDTDFEVFEGGDRTTVISSLVPLTTEQEARIRNTGVDDFFAMVNAGEIDVLDWHTAIS